MISFINNLQDFQYGKEIVQTTKTYKVKTSKFACIKADVAGKSSGQ